MTYDERRSKKGDFETKTASPKTAMVGKRTLVEQANVSPVQRRATGAKADSTTVQDAASRGVATPSSPLPHRATIQQLFGRHDISAVRAHTGSEAAASAHAMGAEAYATGDHVVLGQSTDLHTVAHEAAHVVQQRGGVQLKGGVGVAGDEYEQHADAVADRVVQGKSAELLLDRDAGSRGAPAASAAGVQRKNLKQAGQLGDLTESEQTHKVFGLDVSGLIHTITVGRMAADRTAALVAAAEENAKVGTRIGNLKFHRGGGLFNDGKRGELDPFFVQVTVNFMHKTQAHHLVLLYQHARPFQGYVVSIKDSSNPALQQAQPMEILERPTDPLTSTFKYANRHHKEKGDEEGDKDSDVIAGLTDGTDEKSVDAYTKIAGEGARWECVRSFASKIKNTTRFFTANDKDATTVFAITFASLWRHWEDGFKKRYNIPDSDVAKALRPGGDLQGLRGPATEKSKLTADDYNLDTGAGYVGV